MPTVSDGRDGAVTASAADATEIGSVADAVWAGLPLSVAVAVNVELVALVGVPEIAPVVWLRVRPAGRDPDVMAHL